MPSAKSRAASWPPPTKAMSWPGHSASNKLMVQKVMNLNNIKVIMASKGVYVRDDDWTVIKAIADNFDTIVKWSPATTLTLEERFENGIKILCNSMKDDFPDTKLFTMNELRFYDKSNKSNKSNKKSKAKISVPPLSLREFDQQSTPTTQKSKKSQPAGGETLETLQNLFETYSKGKNKGSILSEIRELALALKQKGVSDADILSCNSHPHVMYMTKPINAIISAVLTPTNTPLSNTSVQQDAETAANTLINGLPKAYAYRDVVNALRKMGNAKASDPDYVNDVLHHVVINMAVAAKFKGPACKSFYKFIDESNINRSDMLDTIKEWLPPTTTAERIYEVAFPALFPPKSDQFKVIKGFKSHTPIIRKQIRGSKTVDGKDAMDKYDVLVDTIGRTTMLQYTAMFMHMLKASATEYATIAKRFSAFGFENPQIFSSFIKILAASPDIDIDNVLEDEDEQTKTKIKDALKLELELKSRKKVAFALPNQSSG